ncbi:aminoglycoside phosphotransferase [Actinoalloteichus hoggarensis]|uniref:Aminoglycoside 3'-phosphotransferase n=1 Tax=Actinoalloteichus hoggarensis TaxID=1470176 RepID=A0A221VYY1_9PSEU|nr:APH(3') family aminoglycoside O-phosphotransferase [Actinoalloteichus hoggarensis]ASO18726.1 Aminoglycoside 3'-phosphotransferase [Actinoalloteichus hoggarensis]MBB5919959.1 aminoglycoside phosphotransferase [Actinoalloteichus hoggarensis]
MTAGSGTRRLPASRPVLDGEWVRVADRSYGTEVFRVEGRHTYYVKTTPPRDPDDPRFHPEGEARRLDWLRGRGFPVPEVVDVGADDSSAWLVTTAVPGLPAAARWPARQRSRVLAGVAELVGELHSSPVEDCPFDGGLRHTLAWAERATRSELVDVADLDEGHTGWTAARLLAELRSAAPPPEDDLVVCHGDPCLDNVLVDPATLRPTGLIDVGRLGTADRWRDLAVLVRNLQGENDGWADGADHASRFLAVYGADHDEYRAAYYRLLDEFF